MPGSLADDLHQHALAPPAVELAVEDLLPRPEVELALGDGDYDFPAHDLAFHVGVGVILAGAVVVILSRGRMRGEFLEPDLIVMM